MKTSVVETFYLNFGYMNVHYNFCQLVTKSCGFNKADKGARGYSLWTGTRLKENLYSVTL